MEPNTVPDVNHTTKHSSSHNFFQSRHTSTIEKDIVPPTMVESLGSNDLHASRSTAKAIVLVATVTTAMLVNIANATSFSIAMATIQRELDLQEYDLQWINSAYPLSSGCLLLVCGRLADLYGRKKTFLIGSVMLMVFTLACGFPKGVVTLDILRGFQGIGAAAQIPAALGILAHSFPPSRARSFAFATFAAGAPVGAVFGSLLGGVLTQYTKQTWRSTCYLLAGFNFLCAIGGAISIDKDVPSKEEDRRVDWLGAFLVTSGLVLIVFVLSQGETAPKTWKTPYIIALLILGVIIVICFGFWQHYLAKVHDNPNAVQSMFTPPPLLRLSLFKSANGRLGAVMLLGFMNWSAFIAFTYWLQLYYQNFKLFTPIQTVVRLLPMFVSGILCNVFIAITISHIPLVWIVGIGTLSTTTACVLLAVIVPGASYWAFGFPAAVLSVLGADFLFSAGSIFIAKFALPHEQSVAGALFNTMTQLGTALGVTVTTVVFHRLSEKKNILPLPETENGGNAIVLYHAAMWTAAGFGFVATILGVTAFRGVGVVGHKNQKSSDVDEEMTQKTSEEEKGDTIDIDSKSER